MLELPTIASFVFFLFVFVVFWKLKTILQLLTHPDELVPLMRFLLFYKQAKIPKTTTTEEKYCYEALTKTSRSFAAVILELSEELRLPVTLPNT